MNMVRELLKNIVIYCGTIVLSCTSPSKEGDQKLALNLAENFTYNLMKATYGSSADNPGFTLDSWEFSPKTGYYTGYFYALGCLLLLLQNHKCKFYSCS